MADLTLFICLSVSFLTTFLLVPRWMNKATGMGLEGKDMNKYDRRKVPEAGGVTVIAGAVSGILIYIFLNTFYFSSEVGAVEIFAALTTILLAGFVGFIDDILGWKSGMTQRTKVLLTIPIAIPLAIVNAGESIMNIPFLGFVDFGMFFPLLLVPLGIIGATNGYNMLAGYNGMEAGTGAIILSTLALISWLSGAGWVSMIALIVAFSLLAFLWFNKVPARIFPGDSLTYAVGATIAVVAILGNMEKFALILFIPFFFDVLMFVRFRFIDKVNNIEAFGKVNKDGSLDMPYGKVYDFTHLMIKLLKVFKKKVYERDVVLMVFLTEFVLALIALSIWSPSS
ncbi:MAG: glycosyl transferase family 4 [Candidatus Aenigmarchaeota archaeon]|nr:glycosyl transferase family 4 [Candidatus Aenigmarchaeota archaeon]